MNERTQELYAKACLYARDKHFEDKDVPAFIQCMSEKFVELIVRECLSIVENNNPRPPGTTIMYSLPTDEYFDTGWQVAVETKSNQIKKHFGVDK
jgi:hypothetical protein